MLIISTCISKSNSGFQVINEFAGIIRQLSSYLIYQCLSLYIIVSSVTHFYVNNIPSSSDWSLETPQ